MKNNLLPMLAALLSMSGQAQDRQIDLAATHTAGNVLTRIYGSVGNGSAGLPVAGGGDLDGDGLVDYAFAAFQASPAGRAQAGQVFVIFGDDKIGGTLDTSEPQARFFSVLGAQTREHTGSEIWMDDVTGDGLADLLICRQDHTPEGGAVGAGALTIMIGSPELRALAGSELDLADANPPTTLLTINGIDIQDRFCMWARTGDVTGDGIADLAIGADQAGTDDSHTGELWLIRGGGHLATAAVVNLAQYGQAGFQLASHSARILPPGNLAHGHFGATCQIADLDGNGRSEVLGASALNRAGGNLRPSPAPESADGSGGTPTGTVHILWDDNIPAGAWPHPFTIDLDAPPGALTTVIGTADNRSFGEELLGGLDYDGNGQADLFVGDLVGRALNRDFSGLGHVLYDVAGLRNQAIDLQSPPPGLRESRIYGPIAGAIGADTGMQGDFDADGVADLAFSSPHDRPFGRTNAGTLHVLFGQAGGWPDVIDLAPGSLPVNVRITEVYGARGSMPGDTGDTLSYSGAAGDVNGDGLTDIFTNEMVGNGVAPDTVDVGNLIILSGAALTGPLFADGFESAQP